MKIAYLIPEFPGQTHNFFWRERTALAEKGVTADLFSTKMPPARNATTSWGKAAQVATTYLYPARPLSLLVDTARAVLSHPAGIVRALCSIARSTDTNLRQKIRMLGLGLLGIQLGLRMKQRGISHVHVHSCADAANIALFAHLTTGISYSLTLHNPVSEYGSNQREKWRHASFAIVIAKWVLADLRSRIPGYLPQDIRLAPMGVDTDKFTRTRAYRPLGPDDEIRLFCCARLNPGKGYLNLVDAVKILIERGKRVSLTIAGEDDQGGQGYRKILERHIRDNHLSDIVTLLGGVTEEAVIEQLESASIFALASMEEPLGVAIMEAMSMCTPVIATNAGGVPELIDDQVDGWLVQPGSVESLVEAVLQICNSPEQVLRTIQRAREKTVQNFSHRVSANAIHSALSKSQNSSAA